MKTSLSARRASQVRVTLARQSIARALRDLTPFARVSGVSEALAALSRAHSELSAQPGASFSLQAVVAEAPSTPRPQKNAISPANPA